LQRLIDVAGSITFSALPPCQMIAWKPPGFLPVTVETAFSARRWTARLRRSTRRRPAGTAPVTVYTFNAVDVRPTITDRMLR